MDVAGPRKEARGSEDGEGKEEEAWGWAESGALQVMGPQNVLSPRSSQERWQGLSLRAPAHTTTSTLASRPRGLILLF